MEIHSNQLHHNLKHGALIGVPIPSEYDPDYQLKMSYENRDLAGFWGYSLQTGRYCYFLHTKIKILREEK